MQSLILPCLLLSCLLAVVSSHGDHDHDHGHVDGHGLSFFEDLAPETQERFEEIWHDRNLQGPAKDRALVELAARTDLNSQQKAEFDRHIAESKQTRETMDQQRDELLSKLSPKLKNAFIKLKEIKENVDVPESLKQRMRKAVLGDLTDEERNELVSFAKERNAMQGHHEHDGHDHGHGHDHDDHDHDDHDHAMDAGSKGAAEKEVDHQHSHKHGELEHEHEHEHATGDTTDHRHTHQESDGKGEHDHTHKHGDMEHSHPHEHKIGGDMANHDHTHGK